MCFKSTIVVVLIFLNCSLSECDRVKRVIGGIEVKCGLHPYVASLRNSSNLEHKCGATIISPRFAVTAAHCVQGKEDEYILSLNNYCSQDDISPRVTIVEIIKNELYDAVTRAHDMALLRLALPPHVTMSQRELLPRSSFGLSGECTLYGYGYRDVNTMETSDRLLAGTLRIVSLDKCEAALGPYVAPKYDGGMICAVGDGVDACQGDSGSPLICAGGKIEGVSSYGMSCGVPGLPGVYTSIGAHLTWIHDIIKDDWNR